MILSTGTPATDPRTTLEPDMLAAANARAASPVAMPSGLTPGLTLGIVGIVMLGGLTFATMSRGRIAPPLTPPGVTSVPVPPAVQQPVARLPDAAPAVISPPPVVQAPPPARPDDSAGRAALAEKLKAPAIVVDLTRNSSAPAAAGTSVGASGDSAEEKFADRLAREEAKPARAVRLPSGAGIVAQGAIISGVLETAINSDLPGFVRAVVSRDVSSFDGSQVLIPAGSRLIGQYRSGLAAGQSRAFVIWTRLIRPDGVSVSLASPATDTLGRAGLSGQVNSHFLKRFGSAVLLSVVQAGLGRLERTNNDLVVRTADDARSVAGIALQRDVNIPPTVKVPQGTPIRIFTARDLDFSGANDK
ncbi:MAG: type IV secretion system protein VirB10 [Sphingomonas sp.]|jgi:type IV secretion system protein VirB10